MVYFIGPSREQCMLCIFTSPNSISHDLKLELHPNYFICLSSIILLLVSDVTRSKVSFDISKYIDHALS
jgi:hypothetical protein